MYDASDQSLARPCRRVGAGQAGHSLPHKFVPVGLLRWVTSRFVALTPASERTSALRCHLLERLDFDVLTSVVADELAASELAQVARTCTALRSLFARKLELLAAEAEERLQAKLLRAGVPWEVNWKRENANQVEQMVKLPNLGLGPVDLAILIHTKLGGSLAGLSMLNLSGNAELGDAGVARLSRCVRPPAASLSGGPRASSKLTVLDLRSTRCGDYGAAGLGAAAAAGHLGALKWARLSDNLIGDAGVGSLCSAADVGGFKNLAALELDANALGDASFSALARSLSAFNELTLLDLEQSRSAAGHLGMAELELRAAARRVELQRNVELQLHIDHRMHNLACHYW